MQEQKINAKSDFRSKARRRGIDATGKKFNELATPAEEEAAPLPKNDRGGGSGAAPVAVIRLVPEEPLAHERKQTGEAKGPGCIRPNPAPSA